MEKREKKLLFELLFFFFLINVIFFVFYQVITLIPLEVKQSIDNFLYKLPKINIHSDSSEVNLIPMALLAFIVVVGCVLSFKTRYICFSLVWCVAILASLLAWQKQGYFSMFSHNFFNFWCILPGLLFCYSDFFILDLIKSQIWKKIIYPLLWYSFVSASLIGQFFLLKIPWRV